MWAQGREALEEREQLAVGRGGYDPRKFQGTLNKGDPGGRWPPERAPQLGASPVPCCNPAVHRWGVVGGGNWGGEERAVGEVEERALVKARLFHSKDGTTKVLVQMTLYD